MNIIKNILFVLAISLLTSLNAFASEINTPTVELNFSLDMPRGVVADVKVTLTNIDTGKDTTIYLQSSNGNKFTFNAEIGTYTLKKADFSVNGYVVKMDDFTLDLEKRPPIFDVVADVKADTSFIFENKNNENKVDNNKPPHGEEISNEEKSEFITDSSNEYFQNMTLNEIKQWYTDEVVAYINRNHTDKKLEDFLSAVTLWADWVTRKPNSALDTTYKLEVELYNTENDRDFYKVQKKMYDFLKDSFNTQNLILNFDEWNVEINHTEISSNTSPSSSPVPNKEEVDESKSDPVITKNPVKDNETDSTSEKQDIQNDKSKDLVNKIMISVTTSLIVIAVISIFVFIKLKNKK